MLSNQPNQDSATKSTANLSPEFDKKAEINFYETTEGELVKSAIALLVKISNETDKILVFSQNTDFLQQLDNSLWSFSKNKFLPHATIFDKEFTANRQPILLSNQLENGNNSKYLLFFDLPNPTEITNSDITKFLAKFSRAFYFFEEGAKNSEISQKISPNNYFKKLAGKWIREELPAVRKANN